MNQLQIFNNPKFGEIRTINENGKVLFCGRDIADALGYTNARDAINRHCRGVAKHDVPHPQSQEKMLEMSFITEGDLYRLITNSKLPAAEKFESWVFDEVLPQIRQTGSYALQPKSQSEMLLMAAQQMVEQERRINIVETSVDTIKDTIVHEFDNWREEIGRMLNRISVRVGPNEFKAVRSESYKSLERRSRCDLERRLNNRIARLVKEGASQSLVKKANKLDCIEEDPKLKEIYTAIVRELVIKHCA